MGLLDLITGGADKKAQDALGAALANIQSVQTPTSAQLQLSPLAQYESTGDLSAALGEASQAGPSAYNNENLSSVPMSTMQQVLAKEGEIANSNGMTPQERASIADAIQSANTATAGQRGAIEQSFAGRGVPQSLISAALQNGTAGQEAQQMYQSALQGQASAANNAQSALQNEGSLASQMYGQQAGQANTVAAAQNALNQFNAANSQQTGLANQANQQTANTYNTTNAQNLANQNVLGKQEVQYNNQVTAPQSAASLALQKAGLSAGVGESQANAATATGQQAAGLFGGLLGAGATLGAGALSPGTTINTTGPIKAAAGGEVPPQPTVAPTAFLRGGQVPGQAQVPGDSQANDTVPARLSPGEYVVPKSVAQNQGVKNFLASVNPQKPPAGAHPSDISSVLRALSILRQGA